MTEQIKLTDLDIVQNLNTVKEANFEEGMGFGTGILKDGRPFCFGRSNGPLEMEIYSDVEAMVKGFEAEEFVNLNA